MCPFPSLLNPGSLCTGKDWGREEKGTTKDEMVEWHHQLNGHESEQTPGDCEGQGSLACCSPWGGKELDMNLATEQQGTGHASISLEPNTKQPPSISDSQMSLHTWRACQNTDYRAALESLRFSSSKKDQKIHILKRVPKWCWCYIYRNFQVMLMFPTLAHF